MKAESFVVIPRVKNKGTEVEMEILPLVQCKECKHMLELDGALECGIKSGWFPVTPDWFCADGEDKNCQ